MKIEEAFKYINTRSVPKQNKPYSRFVEMVKIQLTFEFHNGEGAIVGFRCPAYVEGMHFSGD